MRGSTDGLWAEKDLGFVVVLLVVGLIAGAAGGTHVLQHNLAIQENQPTDATVESTGVDRRVIENDDGPDDYEYRPVVEYSYTAEGKRYAHDNVFPGSFRRWSDSRSWAQSVAGDYQAGQSVEAQYNPHDASEAYIRNDGWPDGWLITVGYALALLVSGVFLIRKGFRRRKQRELMADTPTEQAESLSMGPSEVTGIARPGPSEAATAPFSDEECIVCTWEVLEYDDDDDDGGSWNHVASGLDGVPFYVDDGTGLVLVEPHDDARYEIDPDGETTIRVDADETPPGPIASFIDTTSGVGRVSESSSGGGASEGDRKYRQNLIKPGEDVFVFGTVQPRAEADGGTSNAENLVIRKVPEGDATQEPLFMIADEPQSELISERRWALWRVPAAVVAIVVGVGLLLGTFGPLVGLALPVL
jgi:hypothetical protein